MIGWGDYLVAAGLGLIVAIDIVIFGAIFEAWPMPPVILSVPAILVSGVVAADIGREIIDARSTEGEE